MQHKINWNDLELFYNLYQIKTLVGAAKKLNIDQSTAGRRLAQLETQLNTKLFIRSVEGLKATGRAEDLWYTTFQIQNLVTQFERKLKEKNKKIEIKVSTTDVLAEYFLIGVIKKLKYQYPEIVVHLNTTKQLLDLNQAEADIVVRTGRPAYQNYIVKRLCCWEVGIYASRDYLQHYGEPTLNLKNHSWVEYQQPHLKSERDHHLQANTVTEVNTTSLLIKMIEQGVAIGELPSFYTEKTCLVRIIPQYQRANPYQVWLAYHQDCAQNLGVRVVLDAIIAAFQ